MIRIQIADLLKGLAVVFMIQVHVLELFAVPVIREGYFGKFLMFLGGPLVAPVFVIIMGYFLAATKKTPTQLIKRGVKIFCLGVLLNVALNANLILSVNKGLYHVDLPPYLFGVDILLFAGLATVILALFRNYLKKKLIVSIILVLIISLLGNILPDYPPENIYLKYLAAPFYGSAKWSYFPLFPWLSYALTGLLMYQIKNRYEIMEMLKSKLKWVFVFCVVIILALTSNYTFTTTNRLQNYYHHGILFFIWVLAFLNMYYLLLKKLLEIKGESTVLNYILWLGKNVTAIYVIQWILIGNTATEIYQTVSSPLKLFTFFVMSLLLSSGLCFLYNKLLLVVKNVK